MNLQLVLLSPNVMPLAGCSGLSGSANSVAVKIETISVDVFDGELTQAPGLALERLNDLSAQQGQFLVSGVYIRRKDPVNGRFERSLSSSKEDGDVISRNGTEISSRVEPPDLKTECVAVMLLSPLYVLDWKFRRGMSERRPYSCFVHGNLPRVLRGLIGSALQPRSPHRK